MFDAQYIQMLWDNTVITIGVTLATTLISYVIGIPLGVFLITSAKDGIHPMPAVNWLVSGVVNVLRSVPFLILFIAITPLTRAVVQTTIGPKAMTFGLVVSAAPFVARLVEQSLLEVDGGVIEAAQSMGASNGQIVRKVLLVEAVPSLVTGSLVAATTILGYSAMAGFVGGGGLGDVAIKYGYYRYENVTMIITVVILVLLVQIIQSVGMRIVKKSDKRSKDAA